MRAAKLVAAGGGMAAVAAAAVIANAATNGHEGRLAAACAQQTWPSVVEGRPGAVDQARRGAFVWHDAAGFHVAVKGASGAAPVSAKISADTRLQVVHASTDISGTMRVKANSVTFRLSAGAAALTVKTRCARRASFRFASSATPRPVAAAPLGAQSRPGPTRLVAYLGARRRAPALAFSVTRPGTTGVSGTIYVGSACPVIGPGNQCGRPQPVQERVRIETAPATKGGSGGTVVARVDAAADGTYGADLSPGRYILTVEKTKPAPGTPKPVVVTVDSGVVTGADLYLESAVR